MSRRVDPGKVWEPLTLQLHFSWAAAEDLAERALVSRATLEKFENGRGTPNTNKVGRISRKQLEDVAKIKQPDLTAADLEAAVRTIAGSARSMGVDVEGV